MSWPPAVAVLVVATPCPLILAVPVALVSGLSRAARRGVIVKGGGVVEQLARTKVLLLDKTGTLTIGRPTVVDIVAGHRGQLVGPRALVGPSALRTRRHRSRISSARPWRALQALLRRSRRST